LAVLGRPRRGVMSPPSFGAVKKPTAGEPSGHAARPSVSGIARERASSSSNRVDEGNDLLEECPGRLKTGMGNLRVGRPPVSFFRAKP